MTSAARPNPPAEVVLCPGGPALVRSEEPAIDVVVADGESPTPRPVVAVCRCGRTGRAPWCDGTHKLAVNRTRRHPEASGPARREEST